MSLRFCHQPSDPGKVTGRPVVAAITGPQNWVAGGRMSLLHVSRYLRNSFCMTSQLQLNSINYSICGCGTILISIQPQLGLCFQQPAPDLANRMTWNAALKKAQLGKHNIIPKSLDGLSIIIAHSWNGLLLNYSGFSGSWTSHIRPLARSWASHLKAPRG